MTAYVVGVVDVVGGRRIWLMGLMGLMGLIMMWLMRVTWLVTCS